MTVSPSTSPTPILRVFAKVAHASPSGATSGPRVAAVVRFHLRGLRHQRRPLPEATDPPVAPAPTVQQTFQFGELRAFLEAGRARAAVAGMLSLLPLDLGAECFQAWTGFISSVLVLAASRSRRRNLGGVIGIVRINCLGAAGEDGDSWGGGSSGGAQPLEATSVKAEASTARTAAEDGGCCVEGCRCPICYEALGHGVEVERTPCGHRFHEACIGRWLRSRRTCPVCRFQMPNEAAGVRTTYMAGSS